jgi:plastocyanin
VRRIARFARAAACAIGAVAACARSRPTTHTITIRDFAFAPAEVTVARGDTIVWANADFVAHTTTARDAAWDSKSIDGSSAWRTVMRAAGRHEYYCAFHPNMKATVVVR